MRLPRRRADKEVSVPAFDPFGRPIPNEPVFQGGPTYSGRALLAKRAKTATAKKLKESNRARLLRIARTSPDPAARMWALEQLDELAAKRAEGAVEKKAVASTTESKGIRKLLRRRVNDPDPAVRLDAYLRLREGGLN